MTETVLHVTYIVHGSQKHPDPAKFLFSVLSNPINDTLLIGGGAVTIGALVAYLYLYEVAPLDIAILREALTEDADFLPGMLRLTIGLPLVGAGFAGYFISPVLVISTDSILHLPMRLFLVGVGFLLVYGIATRFAATVGLLAYLSVTVVYAPDLLISSEYIGGFLAIILLGSGRPSVDRLVSRLAEAEGTRYRSVKPVHTLTRRIGHGLDSFQPYTPTVMRLGVGVSFLYASIFDKFLEPGAALAVVSRYHLTGVVPVSPGMWVVGAASVELGLGIALVVGLFTRGVSAVAFGTFTLTLFALPDDPILAHISLFGLTSALLITGSGRFGLDNL